MVTVTLTTGIVSLVSRAELFVSKLRVVTVFFVS